MAVMYAHISCEHPELAVAPRKQLAFTKPTIHEGCTPASWADFINEWGNYKTGNSMPKTTLNSKFMQCLT